MSDNMTIALSGMLQSPLPLWQLRKDAAGQWPYILQDLGGAGLASALSTPGAHTSCPVHGGNDGFRFFNDYADTGGGVCNTCGGFSDGLKLLAWVNHTTTDIVASQVAEWLGSSRVLEARVKAPPVLIIPKDPAKALEAIRKVWKASLPLAGTIAEDYLISRGIWKENLSTALRFHPGLDFWSGSKPNMKFHGKFPCLLAPVKNKEGRLISIHRCFLTPTGAKAKFTSDQGKPLSSRKIMTASEVLNGAAVKLFTPTKVLGIGEGLETVLSGRAITRIPVWSCINKVLLEQIQLPDSVRHVVIFGDKDRSGAGQASAEIAADNCVKQGKTVEILIPAQAIPEDSKGIDWNDVLVNQGIEGFPYRWRNWRPRP